MGSLLSPLVERTGAAWPKMLRAGPGVLVLGPCSADMLTELIFFYVETFLRIDSLASFWKMHDLSLSFKPLHLLSFDVFITFLQ